MGAGGCAGGSPAPGPDALLHAIRVAEDARDASDLALETFRRGLEYPDARVRRTAARAVGRFEEPALVPLLAPALSDTDRGVRIEAVNALGQAGHVRGWARADSALRAALVVEEDPVVRGVYGQTLGRLPYPDPESHAEAERTLASLLAEPWDALVPVAARTRTLALARGAESLARRGRTLRPLRQGTRQLLAELAAHPSPGYDPDPDTSLGVRRIRSTALAALLATDSAPDPSVLRRALGDPSDEVRRVGVRGLERLTGADSLLATALADRAPRVRWEAVRVVGTRRDHLGCGPLIDAADDPDPHVAIQALDLLGRSCPREDRATATLARHAAAGPEDSASWHRWAHAVTSLASSAPRQAGPAIQRLASHPVSFARAWGARAATAGGRVDLLRRLVDDGHHNVREAALRGLVAVGHPETEALAVRESEADDPQLVMTAAGILAGGTDPEAVPALLRALARFTATRRETFRDARVALLEALAKRGGPDRATDLRPLVRDFDPRVAELAAATLTAWTGDSVAPRPVPPTPAPVPSAAVLERLARSSVILEMASGDRIEIRLFPELAPTNAARFARLAGEGYFDGLTFHRVAPNFVVQGGSPGANEYWGDGPFSRDEVGLLGNWRGTVGLSTRGRDTGDGQLYVNLVDNLRLDHDYTVFGEVVAGMEAVDRILEGAVIERALVLGPTR